MTLESALSELNSCVHGEFMEAHDELRGAQARDRAAASLLDRKLKAANTAVKAYIKRAMKRHVSFPRGVLWFVDYTRRKRKPYQINATFTFEVFAVRSGSFRISVKAHCCPKTKAELDAAIDDVKKALSAVEDAQ